MFRRMEAGPREAAIGGIPAQARDHDHLALNTGHAQRDGRKTASDVIRPVIGRLGGRLECTYLAVGEYDVIGIMEVPDNVSAEAFS
jgi:hypothetical protein